MRTSLKGDFQVTRRRNAEEIESCFVFSLPNVFFLPIPSVMRRRTPLISSFESMERGSGKNSRSNVILIALLSAFILLLLFYFHFVVLEGGGSSAAVDYQPRLQSTSHHPKSVEDRAIGDHFDLNSDVRKSESYGFMRALRSVENASDSCGGRYIYAYDLPSRFNEDILNDCRSLSAWTDMCKFTANAGLGPPLENDDGVFSDTSWYATNQFALDIIFNNRMKQYDCLTNDSSLAAAFFVPFYAGFEIAKYLWGYNISTRDAAAHDLLSWLESRPEWGIMGGKDHFLVGGRITWDFRRLTDEESDWGSKLLFLPAAKNMSMLVVESSPWNSNDYAIPYPTYFHPAKDAEITAWKERMRILDRKWLFSFAGAPRPGNPDSIRGQLIEQCRSSNVGKLLECASAEQSECHSPSNIMKMFQNSIFCLQPQGDSYTRRSAFDSMLAGCIPVFFHPGSAYTQYTWHLPKLYTKYSVFIPEDDISKRNISIEEKLSEISAEQVKMMREEVINLIPRLIYADPRSKLVKYKDAFDVSLEAMIKKVTKLRRNMVDDRISKEEYPEALSWKYALLGGHDDDDAVVVGPHEWDPYFNPKNTIAADSRKLEQR